MGAILNALFGNQGILGTLTGAASTAGQIALGVQQQRLAEQRFNYEQNVQQTEWNRQDTAYQRARADAQAAGFSPLAALGTNAGQSGAVVDTSASANASAQGANTMAQGFMTLGQLGQFLSSQEHAREENEQERQIKRDQLDIEEYDAQTRRMVALRDSWFKTREDERSASRELRDQGIYDWNYDYARNNDLPYGAYRQTDRLERIFSGLADYLNDDPGNGYSKFLRTVFGNRDSLPWIFKLFSAEWREDNMFKSDSWKTSDRNEALVNLSNQYFAEQKGESFDVGKLSDEDFKQAAEQLHEVYQRTVSAINDGVAQHHYGAADAQKKIDDAKAQFDISWKELKELYASSLSQ